jgi:hypothetical protein
VRFAAFAAVGVAEGGRQGYDARADEPEYLICVRTGVRPLMRGHCGDRRDAAVDFHDAARKVTIIRAVQHCTV